MGYLFRVIQKLKKRGIQGEPQEIIVFYQMEKRKKNEIFYTPSKPPEISFILEDSEVMEFQLSRLEKEIESMKEEFQKEFYALK